MTRITSLGTSTLDMISILSDGNPGAMVAMMAVANVAEKTDPDSALMVFGPLYALDINGIYGSDIWVLYKDICGQDPVKMIAVLRAVQLGLASEKELKDMIGGLRPGSPARADALLAEVQRELPNFGKQEA